MNAFILIRLDGIPSQQEQLYLRIVKFLFLTGLELKDRYVIKNQLFENIVFPQKSAQALIKICLKGGALILIEDGEGPYYSTYCNLFY